MVSSAAGEAPRAGRWHRTCASIPSEPPHASTNSRWQTSSDASRGRSIFRPQPRPHAILEVPLERPPDWKLRNRSCMQNSRRPATKAVRNEVVTTGRPTDPKPTFHRVGSQVGFVLACARGDPRRHEDPRVTTLCHTCTLFLTRMTTVRSLEMIRFPNSVSVERTAATTALMPCSVTLGRMCMHGKTDTGTKPLSC